jgi:hypothetical protein
VAPVVSGLGEIAEGGRGEPSSVPRFSVRFTEGGAELVLAAPLSLRGGQLSVLRARIERAGRVTDFARGWRAFARQRSTLLELELELDPSWLELGEPADGGLRPVGQEEGGLLVERRRPWGHVALVLRPTLDAGSGPAGTGRELLLVPTDARAVEDGPRPPLVELLPAETSGAKDDAAPRPVFDPRRGALVFGDLLLVALTDALVDHGVRVPERGVAVERVSVRGGKLLLSVGRGDPSDEGHLREQGRRLGPLLLRAAAGEPTDPVELRGLSPKLAAALGGPAAANTPIGALRAAVARRASSEELAQRARAVDESERAPGVATDALLRAMSEVSEPRITRELALRAFARSPSRPEAVARALAHAEAAELSVAAEVLAAAREAAGGPRDPFVDIALARLEERRGDEAAALARWRHAAAARAAPAEAFEGLAEAELRGGRAAEAETAFDRAAALHRAAGRSQGLGRAHLGAARAALAGGEPLRAIERLSQEDVPTSDALALDRDILAARAFRAAGDRARAALAESALLGRLDALGSAAPEHAVDALLAAAHAAIEAGEGSRADAMGAALDRVRPMGGLREGLVEAERAALAARVRAASASGRAALARALSDSLVGRGRPGDAARVLHTAGALEHDLALLRAAIDTALRGGLPAVAMQLVEETLELVGTGPARAALEARRAELAEELARRD